MSNKSDLAKMQELEEKANILMEENRVLAERAEEIFLFAMVSESIATIDTKELLINEVLEKISILKDIPYCAFGKQSGMDLILIQTYTQFSDEHIELSISLTDRMRKKIYNERYLSYPTSKLDKVILETLARQNFKPTSFIFIPYKSVSGEIGSFLFASDDKDANHLHKMAVLIQETINLLTNKLDNLYLMDELQELNTHLEKNVKQRTNELEKTNEQLRSEIESRRLTENELKVRNAELSNFVYRVSHDVRAPISSILGLLNLIQADSHDNTDEYIVRIKDRILNLENYIKNVLSHSRNLNSVIKYECIDFESIVSSCYPELDYLPFFNDIKKNYGLEGSDFFSDQSRMHVIIKNLLSNAIKFYDPDSTNKYIDIYVDIGIKEAKIRIQGSGLNHKSFRIFSICFIEAVKGPMDLELDFIL